MTKDRQIKAEIALLAEVLTVGASTNGHICPWCQGGARLDKSFSVTRTETGVLYNCYRDSCRQANQSAGFIGSSGVHRWGEAKPKGKEPSPFLGDLLPLEGPMYRSLGTHYGLTRETIDRFGVMQDPIMSRYIIPIRDSYGRILGHIARTPPGDTRKPKTLTFRANPDAPWAAVHCACPVREVVLVEDMWSHMRLMQAYPELSVVALLGTHASLEVAIMIGQLRPHKVTIALDPDATRTAIEMRRAHALLWNCPTVVLPLPKDIKDMDECELYGLFD